MKAKKCLHHFLCSGLCRYFDFMGRGDFILYKNTERYFEVRRQNELTIGKYQCDKSSCLLFVLELYNQSINQSINQ